MDDEDDEELELVMPFVVCASNGGPYEDDSFVAGYSVAQVYYELEHEAPNEHTVTVLSECVRQLDLIAMHHGYTMTTESVDEDRLTTVTFTKDD